MTPFKAVVEPDLPGAFLKRSARKIPDVPAVPWMTGLTKDEGCLKSVCKLFNVFYKWYGLNVWMNAIWGQWRSSSC